MLHQKSFKDLTGLHFGYYDVIEEAPSRIQPNRKTVTMWKCRCVCGKINEVSGNHLKNRPNISCGCMKRTTLDDLTGKTFGYIHINNRAEGQIKSNGKKRTMWNCTCLACGKNFVMDSYRVKIQKSCGCIGIKRNQNARIIDYTGNKIGRLYIESRLEDYIKPSGGSERRWNCICDCGKKCVKTSQYLHKSPMPSCGCWKKEQTSELKTKDLIGQTFGYLIPEERLPSIRTSGGNTKVVYRCKCLNCGNYTTVTSGSLLSGQTRSCGCIKSMGELVVRAALINRSINFSTQFYFSDLYLTSPQWPLLFDFAILNDKNELICLIEYQGLQHYIETDKDGLFGKQQREITDRMKKEYCFAHNIPLVEIRYDEIIPEAIDRIITTYVNSVPSSE